MQSKYPKILLLAGWYPHSLDSSDGDFIHRQARLMGQEGIYLDVFHASLSYKYFLHGQLTSRIKKQALGEGIATVIEAPFWPRNTIWTLKRWISVFAKYAIAHISQSQPPDLIHAHCYLGGMVAHEIKKKFAVPYIITLHETSILSRFIPNFHRPLIQKAFKNADELVCVGTALSSSIKAQFGMDSLVLPNFVDPEAFTISNQKEELFTFVFIGDLIARKNAHLLLSTFAKIARGRDVRLVFIGDGPQKKHLQGQVREYNLSEQVVFKGRFSEGEVAKHLKTAHCLILPSKTETFGIVLIESLMCGVPVIATPSGGPADIVTPEVGLLLTSFNVDELSDAMNNMLEHYDQYNPQKLRAYALEHFSARTVSHRYEELYRSVLNQAK